MKTVAALALAAVAVSGSMLAASRAPVTPDYSFAATQSVPAAVAFTNVTVVPMDSERVLRNQTVLVEQGRIRVIGSASEVRVPADATTVDGSGKYLMPGLAEMHGHMPGGSVEEMVMFLYVANGVTTVRGMLGQDGHMELRRKANAGEIVAPTLYMAGPSFSGGSVSSPEQAARRVRTQKEQGWDLLKIHPGLTVPEYDALADPRQSEDRLQDNGAAEQGSELEASQGNHRNESVPQHVPPDDDLAGQPLAPGCPNVLHGHDLENVGTDDPGHVGAVPPRQGQRRPDHLLHVQAGAFPQVVVDQRRGPGEVEDQAED